MLAEGDILALGGDFHVGKTPLSTDAAVCIIRGLPWCGLKTSPRPAIVFDLESHPDSYKRNVLRSAAQYLVKPPDVPQELDAYLGVVPTTTTLTPRP